METWLYETESISRNQSFVVFSMCIYVTDVYRAHLFYLHRLDIYVVYKIAEVMDGYLNPDNPSES